MITTLTIHRQDSAAGVVQALALLFYVRMRRFGYDFDTIRRIWLTEIQPRIEAHD